VRRGMAQWVVTTNLDGLHRKSGLMWHRNLTCLHGDRYVERCTNPECGHELERNYNVRKQLAPRKLHVHDHHIGSCALCGSRVPPSYTGVKGPGDDRSGLVTPTDENCGTKDTHINFGDTLDPRDWNEAEAACGQAALCIVAGTSMTLRHVTHFPFMARQSVIINLQETPDDHRADLRIFAPCDVVFEGLMERLALATDPVPQWAPADPVPRAMVPNVRFRRQWRQLRERFIETQWRAFAVRRLAVLLRNGTAVRHWSLHAARASLHSWAHPPIANEPGRELGCVA